MIYLGHLIVGVTWDLCLELRCNGTISAAFLSLFSAGPDQSREICAQVEACGAEYVEAPVLGSQPEASKGTLLIMVGSHNDPSTSKCWPVLTALGESPTHIGDVRIWSKKKKRRCCVSSESALFKRLLWCYKCTFMYCTISKHSNTFHCSEPCRVAILYPMPLKEGLQLRCSCQHQEVIFSQAFVLDLASKDWWKTQLFKCLAVIQYHNGPLTHT